MPDEKKPPASAGMPDARLKIDREPLLDSHQAAAILKVHPRTLQRLVHSGEIPYGRMKFEPGRSPRDQRGRENGRKLADRQIVVFVGLLCVASNRDKSLIQQRNNTRVSIGHILQQVAPLALLCK
jgi:hypothetical protein